MDVHPPLAKLLITLMAFVSGFQGGSFDFKDIGACLRRAQQKLHPAHYNHYRS